MPQDKFLIAPLEHGLQTNLRPWQIMDDAFERLNNAYTFRGRLRKRFGTLSLGPFGDIQSSRLRIPIGVLDGTGSVAVTVPGAYFAVGQMFSIGEELLTVANTTNPIATLVNGGILDNGASVAPYFHTCAAVSYNTTTGALVITGSFQAPTTPVYFYPADACMGIDTYQTGLVVDSESIYAFDRQFAYAFDPLTGWQRSGTGLNPLWHGTLNDYYWTTSWKGVAADDTAFFVTNFNVTNPNGAGTLNDDPIWATSDGISWAEFYPYFNPAGGAPQTGKYVLSALIVLPFRQRLLLFNTIENNNSNPDPTLTTNSWFPQRCRWSANLNIKAPFDTNAWYEWSVRDNAGNKGVGGSFSDCPTDEAIVSAEYLKDTLIVYFENSTYELKYTANDIEPFVWQKINTELGAVSTFSIVPFDKVVLGIDNIGVHACNGYNVERTDTQIPDQVFQFDDLSTFVSKVAGVRDYEPEMVYWSYKDKQSTTIWPNKLLAYNYRNGSWAVYDDCLTAFGYMTQQTGLTRYNRVIAGTQEGYMVIVDNDTYRNAPCAQISAITTGIGGFVTLTVKQHNCSANDYIAIENCTGLTVLNDNSFLVSNVIDENTLEIDSLAVTIGYTGGGTITRISQIDILSKQYNPYIGKATNFAINKIDFAVGKTTFGQILIDYYTNSSQYSTTANSTTIMGTNVLQTFPYATVPFEVNQTRLWHTIYFDTQGDCIQLHMYLPDAMMINLPIAWSDFELDAMLFYVQQTGRVS